MSTVLDDSIGFDEPAEATPNTPAQDRTVAVIAQDMGRVQNALSEFDRVSAGLADIERRYPKDVVYDVTTTKGMKEATEHRAAWRDPRIMVEKARKMAKAPLLALGKSIDARAAWLTEKLLEGEQPVDQLIKAEEARREAEKQARINAEFARVQKIQEAIAEIHIDAMSVINKSSLDIDARLMTMQAVSLDPLVFQEQMPQAEAAKAQAIAKLEQALKAKRWDEEQEARRLAAEKAEREQREAEAARVAAQAAENARIAAELAARKKEIDDAAAELRHLQEVAAQREARERAAELAAARAESERLERLADERRAALAAPQPEPVTPAVSQAELLERGRQIVDDIIAAEVLLEVLPAEPATLKLGTICDRLGFTVRADFLDDVLHVAPAGRDRAAVLYRESQWPVICRQLLAHIAAMAELHSREAA